jgi:uncharacterized SAM-binding protein YcdF (DUF218 family)
MIKALFSPLLILIFFLFIKDIFLVLRWRTFDKTARIVLKISLFFTFTLYIVCIPWSTRFFANKIEKPCLERTVSFNKNIDIVAVLAAGLSMNRITGKWELGISTHKRVMEGMRFFKEGDADLMVMSGRSSEDAPGKMVELMKETAIRYGVPEDKIILESYSRNTYEHPIGLVKLNICNSQSTIAIVTSAWHMKRAMQAFGKHFKCLIPVPTDFYGGSTSNGIFDFLPNAESLSTTTVIMHELIGSIWYRMKDYE